MERIRTPINWLAIARMSLCAGIAMLLGVVTWLGEEDALREGQISFKLKPAEGTSLQWPTRLALVFTGKENEVRKRYIDVYGGHLVAPSLFVLVREIPSWTERLFIVPITPQENFAFDRIEFAIGTGTFQTVGHGQLEAVAMQEVARKDGSLRGRRIAGDAQPALAITLPWKASPMVSTIPSPLLQATLVALVAFLFCLGMFEVIREIVAALPPMALAAGASNSWTADCLPCLLAMAFGVVASISFAIPMNAHSDEYLHVAAAEFWKFNSLPEPVDSPGVRPTFSHYGVSYLQRLDAGYMIAGHFARLLVPIVPESGKAMRLFNLLLASLTFTLLALLARIWLAPVIFLFLPQAWYLYSYYNGDAWGLSCGLLLALLLALPRSNVQRLLRGELTGSAFWRAIMLFSFLLICLVLTKRNYWLVILLAGLVSVHLVLQCFKAWRCERWRHLALAAVIALGCVGLTFFTAFFYKQWFFPPELTRTLCEAWAIPGFRPSEIAAGTAMSGLQLQARGIGLGELLFEKGWLMRSVFSLFGQFGWTNYYAAMPYYYAMFTLWLVAIGLIIRRCLVRVCQVEALGILAIFLLVPLGIALSAWFSWTLDFQPQGRYLLPILPVLVWLELDGRTRMGHSPSTLPVLALATGSLGVCCLLFVALRIPA